MKKTIFSLIVVLLLTAVATAAGADPFAGRWVLNVQQSRYPPGTCPKSMAIHMEPTEKGIRYRSDTTYGNGATTYSEYIADYDGKQAIVMGAHGMMLPVFLKRIGSNTVVASYTKELQVVATSRRVVSKDGRLMTITTTSKDETGKSITSVAIFDRADPARSGH
jgi:hypothetical protein